MESVHGHNVLNLVKDHQETLTRDALLTVINSHFGAGTRYHTCSLRDLSAQELVDQFVQKGKLIESENGIRYQGCCCKCG